MCDVPLIDVPVPMPTVMVLPEGSTLDVELPDVPSADTFDTADRDHLGGLDEYANALIEGSAVRVGTEGVEVLGRRLKKPIVNVCAQPTRIVLRVDDDADPEFWLQVFIPQETLREWLQAMDVAEDTDERDETTE